MWIEQVKGLPAGYSEGWFAGKRFRVARSDFSAGRSIKVLAEELGGTNFISFNAYLLKGQWVLKPCEMPAEKVLAFLAGFELESSA
ncbi:MAG: peptide methionine sulfoxide reductase [Bacteroidota bacterium]